MQENIITKLVKRSVIELFTKRASKDFLNDIPPFFFFFILTKFCHTDYFFDLMFFIGLLGFIRYYRFIGQHMSLPPMDNGFNTFLIMKGTPAIVPPMGI